MNIKKLQQAIYKIAQPYIHKRRFLSLSIGILYQNKKTIILYNGSDSSRKIDNEPPIYEIGSISKVFTTTLLGELIHEGRVSRNDSIGMYIHELPDDHPVTLQHLANHTSGLPAKSILKFILNRIDSQTFRDPYCLYSLNEVIRYFEKHAKEELKPKFRYSNAGMGFLGHILSLKLNDHYEAAIYDKITNRNNMYDTFITVASEKEHRVLKGYNTKGKDQQPLLLNDFKGAGAIRSTADDLLEFLRSHINMENKGCQLTQQPTIKMTGNSEAGLGWMLEDDIIWHNGGTPGFSSFLGFNKERSLGVVVLSNYRSSLFTINPEQIGKEVLQFMKEGE